MAKRVSILNFKGGVGKTTLAFQVGCRLSKIDNSKVLLCDVDHQSSLSITCLGGVGWDDAVNTNSTIDEIFKYMTLQGHQMPDTSIIHRPSDRLGSLYPNLDILPSALSLDETEIELTGSLMGNAVESEWLKRTLLCRWLEEHKIDELYDYVIFDCPPATKIVTQNALAASHGFIVPVLPDAVSIRGTPHLTNQMLNKIENQFNTLSEFLKTRGHETVSTFINKRKLIGIIIFRVKRANSYSGYTNDIWQHIVNLRRLYPNDEIIDPYVLEGVGVSESMTRRLPVYEFTDRANIGGRGFPDIFMQITDELKRRIDLL